MAARQWASDQVPETEATEMNSTIINFIIFTFAFITFTCHAIMPIIPLQFIYQSSSSIRSLNRCLSNSGSECSSDFVMVWFEVISCFTWKIMSSCLMLYFPFPVFVFFLPFFSSSPPFHSIFGPWVCSKSPAKILFLPSLMSSWVCSAFQLHSMQILSTRDIPKCVPYWIEFVSIQREPAAYTQPPQNASDGRFNQAKLPFEKFIISENILHEKSTVAFV